MNLIAAVDRNWAIGNNLRLLVRISNDQRRFRRLTKGKIVVMGRKTFERFPGGQPLDKRVNIVLTSNRNYSAKGVILAHSLEQLTEILQQYAPEDVFFIGGGTIYEQMLPFCTRAYITRIDYAFEADTWFPNLEQDSSWELVEEGEEQTCFNIEYCFRTYKKLFFSFGEKQGGSNLS